MSNPKQNQSGIYDNRERGSVGDFLKSKVGTNSTLSIVSAYFTIYAFESLKDQLKQIEKLRFLFGEPRFIQSLDPDKTDKKSFKIEDENIQLQSRLKQNQVAKDCADWIRDKVEIYSVKTSNLLHGKMYHVANDGAEEAILGSSNFTVRGLGLSSVQRNNIELNLEVDSRRDRQDLKTWFNELWDDTDLVEDVKDKVLFYLKQLYQNYSPEFIYYKTLLHIFDQYLQDQDTSGLLDRDLQLVDTEIWKTLFEFQKDGVKGVINKIQAYNGCIIADSVGLGKTFEALAVIKYFELRNWRVLVLCPKKLRENWTTYQAQNNSRLNPFLKDRLAYTVLSHTDLSRDSGFTGDIDLETFNWGNYDLIVIDESHNFRNNTKGKKDENGDIIRRSRYQRLMEDIIQGGIPTKVLLLSATPVNNDLKDLRHQIYFMTEGHDDAYLQSLGIRSLKGTLDAAQRTFNQWAKKDPQSGTEDSTKELQERLNADFFKLLDALTIARSRKHIEKYYPETVEELGGFPVRKKPISVTSPIDLKDRFMSYDRLNREISGYRLSLFKPSKYVYQKYRSLYEKDSVKQFSQSSRETHLIGMMKVNFLKRLESSINSFSLTLERTIKKIEALEQQIETFRQIILPNSEEELQDIDLGDMEDEDLQAAMQVGGKLVFQLKHIDVDEWLEDLRHDKEQLNLIYTSAKDVTDERDAKLDYLKQLILKKVQSPTKNKEGKLNRKVLVFTAFADTAAYLYQHLHNWAKETLDIHTSLVTGGQFGNKTTLGRSGFNYILANFSPISKNRSQIDSMPQDDEINLLIATDCISEGQNLQDCDYLINYDIHWNPVRIIQRFGRIDRIGSLNHSVQLVNFWPTKDLNQYIGLKNRVEARMALVDIAATGEDNLLQIDDLENVTQLIEDDLNYRDQQLLQLQEEVLDLEDLDDSISLSEFTLDDFRVELMHYIDSNRKMLEDAPYGIYSVVVAPTDDPIVTSGTIFCLRQKRRSTGNEALNPLQPYFLIYIRSNGDVRYTFTQPKQILEMYRTLCRDQSQADDDLCAWFDQRTNNGADMSIYDQQLRVVMKSLRQSYQRRAINNLLLSRGAKLPKRSEQIRDSDDFELITWLIVK